ncbi:peptidoglycan-binding domain-containing protein [Streptacidiphilus sp. PAMC 29251]
MSGQLCGRCGGSLTGSGCGCPSPDPAGGPEPDEPTAILPAIGHPELVRPYIQPTEVFDAEAFEVDEGVVVEHYQGAYEGSVVPGIDAPHLVRSSRAQVLAGQLVGAPEEHSTEVVPYAPRAGSALPARRTGTAGGVGTAVVTTRRQHGGRGRAGRGRRAALIAAGALTVAALGTAAALAPQLVNGNSGDQAQPLPGITMALPTAAPATASVGTKAPAAVRPSHSAGSHPTVSSSPRASGATPSASAGGGPSSAAPHTNAPNHAPPATGQSTPPPSSAPPGPQSLKLGDQGPAVTTLQQELGTLWIDRRRANGTFDSRTELDVSTFQLWYGVQGDPDGVFGPNSQARMNQLLQHH